MHLAEKISLHKQQMKNKWTGKSSSNSFQGAGVIHTRSILTPAAANSVQKTAKVWELRGEETPQNGEVEIKLLIVNSEVGISWVLSKWAIFSCQCIWDAAGTDFLGTSTATMHLLIPVWWRRGLYKQYL